MENKIAYPEIDNYNLNLLFFKMFSSSTQVFVNLLNTPIQRAYGIEKALLSQMHELAKGIPVNSKALQLVKILKITPRWMFLQEFYITGSVLRVSKSLVHNT